MKLRLLLSLSMLSLIACSRDPEPSPDMNHTAADMRAAGEDLGPDAPEDSPPDLAVADMDAAVDMPGDMSLADADMAPPLEEILDPVALNTPEEAFARVNPFVGTGGIGFGYSALTPAAQAPNGLVKLGPDTTRHGSHTPIQHMSGYNFVDGQVRGFSHIHFVGTGVADLGNLRVMPTRSLEDIGAVKSRWWASQDKMREHAEPGFYTTYLTEPAVEVELTATLRGGAHRYTFDPGDGPAYVAIDAASKINGGSFEVLHVEVAADGTLSGKLTYKGGYTGRKNPFTLHFAGEVSPAPDAAFVWGDEGMMEGATLADADEAAGIVLRWDETPSEPVELRVGISIVDDAAAAASLAREVPLSKSFEEVRAETREVWLEKLSSVQVAGGTEMERDVFFTALYNAYRMPTRLDEPDGRYPGIDGQVHEGITHPYYSDLSLWDSFRTTHPWYQLVDPDLQRDCLLSLMQMSEDGGTIPRWPAMQSYTGGMIGTSADVVFGDAAAKGLEGIDWSKANELLALTSDGPPPEDASFSGRVGMERYDALGYLPDGVTSESVSRTLEFAYHDWGRAQVARRAGAMDDAMRLEQRAGSWRNVFEQETGFFRPRNEDGTFKSAQDFNPEEHFDRGGADYTEGSAWHWRFYVPHDPIGLAQLYGEETFDALLEEYFAMSDMGDHRLGRNILPDSYYWHGNQPPLHTVYMFHATGNYDRLTHWLERIRTAHYDDTPAGLPGNDDGGTLSSWYLFGALGMYPLAGDARYALGAPLFTRVVIASESGEPIEILAPDARPGMRGVERVTIGDAPTEGGYITHEQLTGGNLTFHMKAQR